MSVLNDDDGLIREPAVIQLTGLSSSTIDRLEHAGDFPARVRIGPRSKGWIKREVKHWIESRPRGVSEPPVIRKAGVNLESAA